MKTNKPSETLIQAIAVAAELTGTELSPMAAKVMAMDLSRYPENQVLGALTRCRRELKGRMSPSDVIGRLDDGRPGVEEAWALVPKDEAQTAVWTEEMARAMSAASGLLDEGDAIAARMAFKETYQRLCQDARDRGIPVRWTATLGWDEGGRESVLAQAHEAGKLTDAQVRIYLPSFQCEAPLLDNGSVLALAERMQSK